jgi:hypothetical protein
VCGFHAAVIAWKKSQRKHALPECLKIRQHLGGSSGSEGGHAGQFWTMTDAYLRRNLRVAGIAQW